ncbi:hypothetical protein phytr_7040 [Candidatus Phycorickettsia trachydisci]|uniref:Uncharacterized protein n=1 Tax=Candidatus Phycorickettsia trachydisci TaxID=2115978 RepID=A0A2P1P8Q4_9RICK|nr:ankyrin repeat domain-containing protein [Candidatus Phycorickettsia trachydisci]AVP87644.1 hypothetical protein phytr_7040 [Candidatus Phycorickettsia trachydisci]
MTNHPKDIFENFIFNFHTTDREKLEGVIQQKLTYDSSCCDFLLSKACQEGSTALIYFLLSKACQKNDTQVVSFLIEKGINVKVNFDSSLIICAIQHGSQEIARILIESGADVNAESDYWQRPLHLAVKNGQLDIVRLLLDRGADINASSIHVGTPLQLAAKKGQEEMVRLLLDRGADIKAPSGREPLEWAAAEGHVKVVELLLDRGADIEAGHETPLQMAAKAGQVDVVRLLLDRGADIEPQCISGFTPLLWAATTGHVKVVELLIDRGANIEAKSNQGFRGLHSSVKHFEVMKLLLDRGAEVDTLSDGGHSPLHYAAQDGKEEVVQLLLDRGADIELQNESGDGPIHRAATQGEMKVVELLLDRGADINAQNHRGERLLYCFAESGNVKRVKWLLDKGADVYVLNNQGKNVLEFVGSSKVEMISFFCHYKGLLDLNKSSISSLLKKNINKIIKHELNEPNNNMDGLRNVLEAFSNADNNAFCKDFLKKVKKHVQSSGFVPKLKLDLDNDTNIKKFLLARSKLEDLKKLFSSIESEQTDPYLESLSCIASKVYEKVNQYWEQIDKHIVDLGNKVIDPTYPLGKIAKTEASKNIFELLGKDMTELFQTRDHRRQTLANNQAEAATKKLKTDEGTEDNDHSGMSDISDNLPTEVCSDVGLSTVGSGGIEECKGQG